MLGAPRKLTTITGAKAWLLFGCGRCIEIASTVLVFWGGFFSHALLLGQSAIPEPPVVLYGILKGPGALDVEVNWSGSGNGESIEIPLKRKVQVDGMVYYVVHIPFETREVVGIDDLPATENVFGLGREDKDYRLSVSVAGSEIALTEDEAVFPYGVWSQGLVKQVDLLFGESYEEWSNRIFGKLVGENEDPDADGVNNYTEYLKDTDPLDPLSRVWVKNVTFPSGGQMALQIDTSPEYRYTFEVSQDLDNWERIQLDPIVGNGESVVRMLNLGSSEKIFYRIVAEKLEQE